MPRARRHEGAAAIRLLSLNTFARARHPARRVSNHLDDKSYRTGDSSSSRYGDLGNLTSAFSEDLIVRPPHISNAAFFVQVQWQIASEHHRDAVFGRQCRGSCLRSYCNRWAYTVTDGRATTGKRVSRIGAPANIG